MILHLKYKFFLYFQIFLKTISGKTLQSLCGIAPDATEANLAGPGIDADDAAVLAEDIQDKGALSKLTIFGYGRRPAILELGMTEGNFSNAGLGTGGAIILASWIEHK